MDTPGLDPAAGTGAAAEAAGAAPGVATEPLSRPRRPRRRAGFGFGGGLLNVRSGMTDEERRAIKRQALALAGPASLEFLLKLEPGEARRVAIASTHDGALIEVGEQIHDLCLRGDSLAAQHYADTEVLIKRLGLSRKDVELLATAADLLRDRRTARVVNSDQTA